MIALGPGFLAAKFLYLFAVPEQTATCAVVSSEFVQAHSVTFPRGPRYKGGSTPPLSIEVKEHYAATIHLDGKVHHIPIPVARKNVLDDHFVRITYSTLRNGEICVLQIHD